MGQHKIEGASLGSGYKKNQKLVSGYVRTYTTRLGPNKSLSVGDVFQMQDKKKYRVDINGCFRRV